MFEKWQEDALTHLFVMNGRNPIDTQTIIGEFPFLHWYGIGLNPYQAAERAAVTLWPDRFPTKRKP